MQIVAASPAMPARQPIVGIRLGLSSADPKNMIARTLTVPMILPSVLTFTSCHIKSVIQVCPGI